MAGPEARGLAAGTTYLTEQGQIKGRYLDDVVVLCGLWQPWGKKRAKQNRESNRRCCTTSTDHCCPTYELVLLAPSRTAILS